MPCFRYLLLILTCSALNACSVLSPYSDLTKLELHINASEQLNPDLHGRPSPLVLQLVELSHPTAFEQADYFALQHRAPQLLAADLLAMEELELRPGEQRMLKLALQPQTRYLGLVASYRDLNSSRWRITVDVQQRERNAAQIQLNAYGFGQANSDGAP